MTFKNTLIIYLILTFFLFNIFLITPVSGGSPNIIWDTQSSQVMKPNETRDVPTIAYNPNRYEVVVHLSISSNYSGVPEQDTYFSPSLNGWSAKLNETDFILEENEKRIIPLIIKSPKSVVNGEVYGLFFGVYVENYYFPRFNDNSSYVFSAIIEYNDTNENVDNEFNNSDQIQSPTKNSKQERLDEDFKIENYYLEIAGSILIITIIIAIFTVYKRS